MHARFLCNLVYFVSLWLPFRFLAQEFFAEKQDAEVPAVQSRNRSLQTFRVVIGFPVCPFRPDYLSGIRYPGLRASMTRCDPGFTQGPLGRDRGCWCER